MKTIPILFRKNIPLVLFALLGNALSAQEALLNPTTTVYDGFSTDIKTFVCPSFSIQETLQENDFSDQSVPLIFAKKFDTEITTVNSGQWEKVDDLHVWRYRITSKDAYSMMLIFKNMRLPDDTSLFLYNEDMSYVVGPVTNNYNKESDIYPTELVPGSSIIVELVVKDSSYKEGASYFTIGNVSHDFLDVFDLVSSTEKPKKILDCHNDINCAVGNEWQTHKRGVALITVGGTGLCSGSLINNTANNGKPLFLTADHCYGLLSNPANSVFYFNHEKEECDGPKSDYRKNDDVIKVSGATRISSNDYADMLLLQLNDRIPSSYKAYFPGWDRSEHNPYRGIVIHHPRGNPKKITFDDQPLIPNPDPVDVKITPTLTRTFEAYTLWESHPDNASIEGGSSGSPLFNQDGKIIGNSTATNSEEYVGGWPFPEIRHKYFCPPENHSYFGRLSASWNYGGSSQRLRDHLDPNNTNQMSIQGLIPAGWRHFKFPQNTNTRKVHNSAYDVVHVGLGNQIFYRAPNNQIQMYYWNIAGWQHGTIQPTSSASDLVNGDIAVGLGNQVFYRSINGSIHTMYWANNNWQHGVLGGSVHSSPHSLALGDVNNEVYYRGTDNKMHIYYWSNNAWQHGVISGSINNNTKIDGDIVVGSQGTQVFYRGGDGKLQMYYWGNNAWVHAYVDPAGSNAYSGYNIHSAPGAISIDKNNNNTVYYRGADNKMHRYYWSSNSWQHEWLGTSNDTNVYGDVSAGEGNQIFYRGTDGKMHLYYRSNNNTWIHDWVETSWQAPNANNVAGSIGVGPGNKLFYRGNNGFMQNYFWNAAQMLKNNEDSENFGMEDTPPSPTIPKASINTAQSTMVPNPAKDDITLTMDCEYKTTIKIMVTDMKGKTVMDYSHKTEAGKNSITLNISKLHTGVYFVTIQDTKGYSAVHKLIKN
ncbi:T9SS type A sorting domain-containing protein [Chryseobacterium sp. SSA4.19]|uniref:T9SS type A sorting domain-containing protein n=1 Tax=Chryseobacterium sp. SSA4.19 TaxID=2919915 RepID=UPI001F4DF763|nr:T9SS type A sorting domain-containing protein [Chryseobacterium sp. SSA4.19]MCJ8154865.1 T9SS type A sorting domain-containing protein [Chryseobacterium sp. SSA4.19]